MLNLPELPPPPHPSGTQKFVQDFYIQCHKIWYTPSAISICKCSLCHFLLHFFCHQIVYFKKLTAIKDLVDLMKVVQAQVDMPANTPKDLINLIFSNDSSQVLDTIQDTGHNPFSSQWNPPDQPDATPHPDDPGFDGGFFCMPCFHRYRKILTIN